MITVFHYVGYAALVVVAVIASYTDIRARRIPNWLTVPALVLGLTLGFAAEGFPGLLASLSSVALCGGAFFVLFILGGMGAGDVKMMAAVAALASWPMAVYALMYTALAGGLLAFIVLILRGRLGGTFRRMFTLKTYRDAKSRADAEDEAERSAGEGPAGQADSPAPVTPPAADPEQIYIPYGPAIAAGAILAMLI